MERKRGLQSFIDGVLGHPMLRTSVTVRQFFSPEIYALDFAGERRILDRIIIAVSSYLANV